MYINKEMDKEDVLQIYNGILAIKKNKMVPFIAPWIDLEIIILSEVSQKEKDKYHMISLNVWTLKYGTDEPIYKTETQSQTESHRESRFVVAKRKESRGGMDW